MTDSEKDIAKTLAAFEERLWLEGMEAYQALCMPDVVMVFPHPAGIMHGLENVKKSLEGMPRWKNLKTRNTKLVSHGQCAVRAYEAQAERHNENGAEKQVYQAYCSSTWMRMTDSADWKLLIHTQSVKETGE